MYYLGIEVFLAIVRTQSISRAAQQLNLAQSTTSKRLKLLEQEIGTSLIERGKGLKDIRLTPIGEEFVELAKRWDQLLQETHILQEKKSNAALSIGTLDSFNYAILPILYQKLSQHLPKISLQIITAHSSDFYNYIENRRVDVAFTLEELEYPNVIVTKCYSEPMVGLRIASANGNQNTVVHPRELEPNCELFIPWGLSYQIWHNEWWNPMIPERTKLDTVQSILSCLYHPKQWAIVPLSVAQKALVQQKWELFYLSETPPARICYKLTHKHPKDSKIASLAIFDTYFHSLVQEIFHKKTAPTN